ncbi:hypothetical protein JQS43_22165 [Natronosporangium hydrolyticum]|uniref:Uncharacterized protein n=1 Tax=Natronosporangium hydrolyticum TaxID=2811111 RepID=A0A895YDE1_9ACTN|nr:hypothetical protein [Natronosporangium hydrolyticum]QSB14192.1 hypothetical protein JQS43_22165 [Natronosporangium hydrolyticum]
MVPEESSRHLCELLSLLDSSLSEWEGAVSDPKAGLWMVQEGSQLADDDRRIGSRYALSAQAALGISAGIDTMGCLRSSLNVTWEGQSKARVAVHRYGQPTLVRAALENAATAVWLLGPKDSTDRIVNRLRLAWKEIHPTYGLYDRLGVTLPKTEEEMRQQVVQALFAAGWCKPDDCKKTDWNAATVLLGSFGYEKVVEEAGEIVGMGKDVAAATWSACSGLAHGQESSTNSALARQKVADLYPGIGLGYYSLDIGLMLGWARVAKTMLDKAITLYRVSAGSS